MMPLSIRTCIALAACLINGWTSQAGTSALWGTNGELWSATSRLPDFSHAGYHQGEVPLPQLPPGVNVRDYGAKGDGASDDTAAFLRAIAEAPGVIEIPAGRYVITNILEITRSGVVLRGAGPDRTTLYFPLPLQTIKPQWSATTDGKKTSNYSWAGGLIWFKGSLGRRILAEVTAPAARGEQTLKVSQTNHLMVGQTVQLWQNDNADNSLARELYSGDPGKIDNLYATTRTLMVARIVSIQGDTVTLDRPLRCRHQPLWHARLCLYEPSLTESGVENLRLEFPNVPYDGHFKEQGYNGVAFTGVADCWARNLMITNCDSGVFPDGVFCTLEQIQFDSGRGVDATLNCNGHHGLDCAGHDNLFTDFVFHQRFVHDLSMEHCASGNVIAHGSGDDLCFDHHVCSPFENLYTDIDAGAGTRLWRCGGGAGLGKHSGTRETFWNIRAAQSQSWPPADFGPVTLNFVGVASTLPTVTEPNGRWWETLPAGTLTPANLYTAQLDRRLKGK
ncbi:MAG TPA: glycosyl hydrolase family 28-related protein [Verrucomicrobiae bacterium]